MNKWYRNKLLLEEILREQKAECKGYINMELRNSQNGKWKHMQTL